MNITITRALKELKILEARIANEINGLNLLDISQNKYPGLALKSKNTIEGFITQKKADYQSVRDLIIRRNSIKNAIIKSNANTTFTIGNKAMSVAEAIDQKSFIEHKKKLLHMLIAQKSRIDTELENGRAALESSLQQMIQQNLGKDKKTNSEDYNMIAEPFIKANKFNLIDPIEIDKEIKDLKEEILTFENEIDIKLSEVNAISIISI
jgi:hypothetical protein